MEFPSINDRDYDLLRKIVINTALGGGGGGGGGFDGTVATYAALPSPVGLDGKNYLVTTATGVPFVNRRPAGIYTSDGVNWNYDGDLTDIYFASTLAWSKITGKPTCFDPCAHAATHTDGTDDIQNATAAQKGLATAAQILKLDGIEPGADVTDANNVGAAIAGQPTKTTPVAGDSLALIDSAAGDALKRLTWADLLAAIGPGTGTVTDVSVTPNDGITASVNNPTTTPEIVLGLGDITPLSVAAVGTVTGANLSGTNTGDQTSVTGNAGTATALQTSRNIDGIAFNGTADILVIAPATHAASSKATPVDADEIPLADSAASFALKKLTWANVKATAKTYFDTVYDPLVTDGWSAAGETWTFASSTTFTVSGDVTAKYNKGDKLKLTQTTVKYFYIINTSFSSGTTTITVTGGSDYSLANASITSPFYSKQQTPNGFPQWFNYTITFTGFSANPTVGKARFTIQGTQCTIVRSISAVGTSNSTAYTETIPVISNGSQTNQFWHAFGRCFNNSAYVATPAMGVVFWNSSTLTFNLSGATANFTASGTKMVEYFTLTYEI